jgi:hypothetical protein
VKTLFHSFLTSMLDGGEWLTPPHGALLPEKQPLQPLRMRLDGPSKRRRPCAEKSVRITLWRPQVNFKTVTKNSNVLNRSNELSVTSSGRLPPENDPAIGHWRGCERCGEENHLLSPP